MTFAARIAAGILVAATLISPHSAVVAAPSALPASCSPQAPSGGGEYTKLVTANNGFGFRLLQRLGANAAGKNLFVSPASIALALEMTYQGARAGTQSAMAGTLGLQDMPVQAVRSSAGSLLLALRSADPKVQLSVANAIYARAGIQFKKAFLKTVSSSYGAKVSTADFKAPGTVSAINSWVSCATGGTINRIVERLTPDDLMLLLNALYFHGDWSAPFENARTRPGPFTLTSGQTKTVPYMAQMALFGYSQGRDFQSVRLPYGKGRFGMTVVLPRTTKSVAGLTRMLDNSHWKKWTGSMRPAEVDLGLPRFSLHDQHELKPALAAMGMGVAFDARADLSGICARCVITGVIHKSYLRVNERGTTAAAVTAVRVGPTAMPAQVAQMVINRPFLVAVTDSTTGTVLFAGAVANPGA